MTALRAKIHDSITGIGIAGLLLPEAVAYAGIAGLPPGRALVAAIAGGLIYALAGRSRFAIISPTSSSAAILAAALASLPGDPATRAAMATAMVAMVGAIFCAFALFRMGSLSSFISRPVLRGFAFGLAITIIIKQLPKLLGITVASGPIGGMIADIIASAGAIHPFSVVVGGVALGLLLWLRRFPHLPATLLVIAGGIALTTIADLPGHGVALAGPVPIDFGLPVLPPGFAVWTRMAQLAAPIALIVFAESWGTMRGLALRHGDTIAANRELGAIGLANLASALVRGMPVGAGFSVGSANESAGAQSRLAGAVAAIALLLLALFAGPWIARIPEPVLGAVVIAALSHALSPAPIARLFRIGRDQWVALAAALGVLSLGVLDGMLAAVGLSIAVLLYDMAHPSISELGRVGDGHDFVDIARHADARPAPGVAIYRPNAPLIFANAESVLAAIATQALAKPADTVVLSLEQSSDLDATACDAIGEFAQLMAKNGRRVILARAHDEVREVLTAAGLTTLVQNATYSVADAARMAARGDTSWH